jgi:hypothetical protein
MNPEESGRGGPGDLGGVPRSEGSQGGAPVDRVLPLPEEPVALRTRTRALVEAAPAQGAALIDGAEWIAGPLWERWGPLLEPAGMTRSRFLEIVAGYRRELWLWVMGERTWAQSAGGLLGRVQRRLPPDRPAR